MIEGFKDALAVKPAQGFCVSAGFWLLAAVLIYLPKELQYIVPVGQHILVLGAVGYLIPFFKGIPDWLKARKEIEERKENIKSLNLAAKDVLWSLLVRNRRTYDVNVGNPELVDHNIIDILDYGVPMSISTYAITEEYWPILRKYGKELLYEGKHKPSNSWPTD